ncbi:hypothetical protein FNW25_15840 [Flavobacterium franklandianum]|uniref:hypothetical protein n=1 Tax=Flavobacterium franklandianum TaxID=2594430 RepID=UPI00117AB50A|nr:hypothetical protein [Flavobacterium franklandianum]TRX21472.1 hypothetical protein FNW25_15840 [Flavobacterium franklandianum]
MKNVLILTLLLCNVYANAQWKIDTKKSDDIDKVYTCKVGNVEISKRTSDMSPNTDLEANCGIIEMYNRNITRDASGNGLFINTKGILDDIVRNPGKKCTVSIVFTDGTAIKKNNAIHMVEKAEPKYGFPSSNLVSIEDLNKSEFILLRDKLIKEIIINNKHIPIVNSRDIKKAAGIVWFNVKP